MTRITDSIICFVIVVFLSMLPSYHSLRLSLYKTAARSVSASSTLRVYAWKRVNSNNEVDIEINDERIRRSLEAADVGEFAFPSSSSSSSSKQSMHGKSTIRSFSSSSSLSRSGNGYRNTRDTSSSRLRSGERPSYANNYNRGPRIDKKTGKPKLYQNGRVLLDDGRVKPQDEDFDGDHIFGIMPVKAALMSSRGRTITEMLTQQGMDITNKKDEASVRELLALAKEKNIPLREFPKHDLNMVVENKPHQGID